MTSAKDAQTEREATLLMARQVAEGSRTLGLHIKQHDEISEEASRWAQEVIAEGRKQLEEAHGRATADVLASLRQTASELAKGNEELLQRMEAGIKAAEDSIANGSQLLLSPNPPKDGDTATERRFRGKRGQSSGVIRGHPGRWEAGSGPQWPLGAPMAVCNRRRGTIWRERAQQETLTDGVGASLRGHSVGRSVSQLPREPSGWEWNRSQPGKGAKDLALPWPGFWKMQGEAACRAGEPSHQGEDASAQRPGGHDLLAQADSRRPAGEVMRHHLDRQPGTVGGETP